MARPPRTCIPGVALHVVQRGHNKSPVFFTDADRHQYIDKLVDGLQRYETRLHAYVLMTNHVHLLLTSSRSDGISRTLQFAGSAYARHINRKNDRTGAIWEARFFSSPVDSDSYAMACYRYIEMNPVRAGLVRSATEYRWSSHTQNIGLRKPRIVEAHASFLELGPTLRDSMLRYRELFRDQLPDTVIDTIRTTTRRGKPFGSDRFRAEIEHRKRLAEPGSTGPKARKQ